MKVLSKKQVFDQYKQDIVEDGWTFNEMLDYLNFPEDVRDYVEIRVNGQKVKREYWKYARPNLDTHVAIAIVPAGGGNDLFRTAFVLGSIALGGALASNLVGGGAAFSSLSFGQQVGRGLVAGAFTLLGSTLANSMFPPPVPGLPEANRNNLASVTGQSNSITPNDVVIRNYGRNRVFPRVVAQPYTYYVGRDQYIVSLYDFGSGRQTLDVGTLRIGNTPINRYKDIDYRITSTNQFQIYRNKINTTAVNFLFENLYDSAIRTTAENTESIELSFTWPNGLFGLFGRKQKRRTLLQDLVIEIRETGSSTWTNINRYDVELDPGLRSNKNYVAVLGLPTTSTFIRSNDIFVPNIFGSPGGTTIENDIYESTFASGNLFFHRPIEESDQVSLPDDTSSRFLLAGDRIKIGNEDFLVLEANVAQTTFSGQEFQAARLNKILGYQSRYEVRGISLQTQNGIVAAETQADVRFLPYLRSETINQVITITSRSTSGFRYELKVNPNLGPKQWDIRVTYAGLDVGGSFDLASSRTRIFDDFSWDQIKGYEQVNPVRTTQQHLYLELKAKASDEISGQIETLSAEISSFLPVYDEVNGIWKEEISSNPAWVFASILTNEANQRRVQLSQLDETSLSNWARYCEENTITYQGNTVGFECNFVHDYPITVKQLLEQVCSVGRATINIVNGRYGVIVDELRDTPTQMFNQRNIVSMDVSRSYEPTPDALRVKFIDPNSNWQENSVIAFDDGKDSNNSELIEDLEAFGCTDLAQAWRLGRYTLAQQKLRRDNVALTVDFEGLACSRGDLVFFSHDVKKEGGVPARVKSINGNQITIDEVAVDQGGNQVLTVRKRSNGQISDYNIISFVSDFVIEVDDATGISTDDLCVYGVEEQVIKQYIVKAIRPSGNFQSEIDLIEYNEAIYQADDGLIPDYEIVTLDNPLGKSFAPSPVRNLSGEYNIDVNVGEKRYNYNITLDWDEPIKGFVKTYEVYLTVNGETNLVGFTDSSNINLPIDANFIGVEHKYRVLAVNVLGEKITLTEAESFIFTPNEDETPPEDVENFNANVLTDTVELDWSAVADLDVDKYLIRFSPDTSTAQWPQSTPVTSAGANQLTATVPLRTGTYLIRAVDFAGNFSPNAARVVTSVPEISKIEFITNVSAPSWVGSFDQTQLLGDSLILRSVDNLDTFVDDIGEFFFEEVFDLGDIFTARFVADVVASGFSKTGLMANWTTLASIDPIAGQFTNDDFDASAFIRTRNQPDTMVNWTPLSTVDYLSFGSELTASPWVKFKAGDFTGRIFQLKVRLESELPTVTPIVYSVNIDANWNERLLDGKDQLSGDPVVFDGAFVERPAVEITAIQNTQARDYFLFTQIDETGFTVQFYDENDNEVFDRTFDFIVKGIGKKYTLEDINF